MATEKGVVVEITGKKAVVRVRKSSACAHCESRGSCHVMSGGEMLVDVTNGLSAKVNDNVEISMPTRSLLKLTALVYGLPIVALIVGAYAGGEWASFFHLQPTGGSIVVGGFAMGVTFFLLKRLDRAAQAKGEYQPRMRRILP